MMTIKMKNKIAKILYGKVNKEFYRENSKLLNRANYNVVRILYIGMFFLCSIYFIISMFYKPLFTARGFLAAGVTLTALGSIFVLTAVKRKLDLVSCFYYGISAILLISCTAMGSFVNPGFPAVTVFIAILVISVSYINPPVRSVLLAGSCYVVYVLVVLVKNEYWQVIEINILDTLLALILTLLMIYYVNSLHLTNLLAKMRYQIRSELDGLTTLFNKSYTENQCRLYMEEKSEDETCVMMIINVDNINDVNDFYGYQMGDNALQTMGQILKSIFRERDIIGRVGGDEFLVCMKAVRDIKIVSKRANEILVKYRKQTHEIGIENGSCSIGITIAAEGTQGYQSIFNRAKQAMYEVKRNGKDNVIIQ